MAPPLANSTHNHVGMELSTVDAVIKTLNSGVLEVLQIVRSLQQIITVRRFSLLT